MTLAARQAQYERLNGKYLREGVKLLRRGDYAQASEKFWGAASEIIKAAAAKRGVALGTHRSLGDFVERLDREHPEWGLPRLFHVANSLHTNFYEDSLPPSLVREGGEAVRELVRQVRRLLD